MNIHNAVAQLINQTQTSMSTYQPGSDPYAFINRLVEKNKDQQQQPQQQTQQQQQQRKDEPQFLSEVIEI